MPLRIRAYAKTNLYLAITAKRPDGYHDIETIFQSISLADDLVIEEGDGFSLTIETAEGLPTLEATDDNLILKAARALADQSGARIPGARFHLVKRIPIGAGLGGGSADAAAALWGLNHLYSLNLKPGVLYSAAVEVGMDVPFFLTGGTALATGRGDILRPLVCQLRPWLVMVFPEFPISTRRAYDAWQREQYRLADRPPMELMISAVEAGNWNDFGKAVHNDFETLLARDFPQIARIKDDMIEAGCEVAWLSGSGSAVMGTSRYQGAVELAAGTLGLAHRHVRVIHFTPKALELAED